MFSISILFDGSLEILNATKNDEGVYTCFAENDRGKANSSGYLTITGQRVSAYTCVHLEIQFVLTFSCISINVLTLIVMFLFPRGYQHHRSTWRHRGKGWWWGDSEVRRFIRPHAGHCIHLGHRLQGHRLWLWVATLRTCYGRVMVHLNSYRSLTAT